MPLSWTRTDLFNATIAYADRYDADVSNTLETMLGMAEDRMSRIMRNREMSAIYTTPVTGAEYYDLPTDFAGLRDIKLVSDAGRPFTLHYVTPEQANNIVANSHSSSYYNIVANKLRIISVIEGDGTLELVYYQRVPPLDAHDSTNWVLQHHGDIYKTAMLAEVETFVKNDPRASMFHQQLASMFDEMSHRDDLDRWSGTPMAVKLETQYGH